MLGAQVALILLTFVARTWEDSLESLGASKRQVTPRLQPDINLGLPRPQEGSDCW